MLRALTCLLFLGITSLAAEGVSVRGEQILLDGRPTKILGLRCSNALINDSATDDLIAAFDLYQAYGLNTVSVFVMGSRFGDVRGYLPDSSLNPVYRDRLERLLEATAERGMIAIVGCLYWSVSKAKDGLQDWTQADADRAVVNTAAWLREKGFTKVILDPDNEGMAGKATGWKIESMIRAAKEVNPKLVIANNTHQNPANEDLNMHFGKAEEGKPWFDSEATPSNAPGGYWSRYSKQAHQADQAFYNYSRIGRYTAEMKAEQIARTRAEIERFNGFVLASTWLQCSPAEAINGPFAQPGGRSNLGSGDDPAAAWNRGIDKLQPDAGILWWLEFVKANYAHGN